MKNCCSTSYRKYTIGFPDIRDSGNSIRFINHSNNNETDVCLSLEDTEFKSRAYKEFPSIIADLIDLAVAIFASDRLVFQNPRQEQSYLHINLPVRHPELLTTDRFQTQLETLLEWATGSRWYFNFQQRTLLDRPTVDQASLPTVTGEQEVALWSGGLDSLAGLYTRLQDNQENSFVLFGTGSNDIVYALQKRVANEIQRLFPGRCELYRVPVRFSASAAHRKNKIPRARGVVFTLLGSACAYLMGQRVLHVYENGIGAINLPYRSSALGLDHTRSVHPLTLLMVSNLVSEVIGEKFQVKNPFLFWTKAEMCKSLSKDRRSELSAQTISCDSRHRHKISQCGYCSSCLLRRQALAASKVEDQTQYFLIHGNRQPAHFDLFLSHMLEQIKTFRNLLGRANSFDLQWKALAQKFPTLDDIVDQCAKLESLQPHDMQVRLIQLYENYASEWDIVESQIKNGFSKEREAHQEFCKTMPAAQ